MLQTNLKSMLNQVDSKVNKSFQKTIIKMGKFWAKYYRTAIIQSSFHQIKIRAKMKLLLK